MISPLPRLAPRRGLLASLALASLLAVVPLPVLSAAAHDPGRSGAGMGVRVPLLLETGARLGVPGAAASLSRPTTLPGRGPTLAAPTRSVAQLPLREPGGLARTVRLASLGRRQLEGG